MQGSYANPQSMICSFHMSRKGHAMYSRWFVLSGLLLLIVLTFPQSSDGNAPPTSDDRIRSLEEKVASLQKRVTRLEQHLSAEPQSPPKKRMDTGAGDWRKLSNWAKIKRGMSKDQVIRLLGEPTRRTIAGSMLHWEGYAEEAGAEVSGNVWFNSGKAANIRPPVW